MGLIGTGKFPDLGVVLWVYTGVKIPQAVHLRFKQFTTYWAYYS